MTNNEFSMPLANALANGNNCKDCLGRGFNIVELGTPMSTKKGKVYGPIMKGMPKTIITQYCLCVRKKLFPEEIKKEYIAFKNLRSNMRLAKSDV